MLGFLVGLQRRAKTLLHHLIDVTELLQYGSNKKGKPLKKLWSPTKDFAAMEVSKQLKQVFEVIDENGDGKISPSELSQVLLCLGYDESVAKEEAQGMVRELDYDGDGFVDLDEFMDAVVNDGEEDFDHLLMDAFLVFDSDKNGKISAKELRRVLVNLGCDKCSLGECRRMIKGVDKDGDGFVDFHEFRLMMMTSKA